MIIIHKLNDFLFNLFPKTREKGSSVDAIRKELTDYYTFGPYRPKVEIDGDFVKVEFDTSAISSQKAEFDTAVKYCEKGKFRKAKPMLEKLIKKNPTVSEYHRILGQIYSEEGEQDKAVNCLIDAIRWDPRNNHALIMMGNVFARHYNDIETAMTYYEQALDANPADHIAMNNIGANLMQLGRFKEAEKYFENAFKINNSYPNTLYALAMIEDVKGNYLKAFDFVIQSMKKCKPADLLYKNAVTLATEISNKIVIQTDRQTDISLIREYSRKLSSECGKSVNIVEDQSIPTVAKLEIAENYNRENHIVRFKKGSHGLAHLIMHELVHLDLTIQARKKEANFLFVSTKEHKELFIRDNEPVVRKMNLKGFSDKSIADFITAVFNGMNSQIYNAPVDLFIEDFLYKTYTDLRPFQYISLLALQKEYIESAVNRQIIKYSSDFIRKANLILNLVHCLQFNDLFGYDLIPSYKTTSQDMKMAKKFYQEYLQYQKNNQSLEAYKLIQHWAEELKIDRYFTMVEENEYRSRKVDTDQIINTIEEKRLHVEKFEADSALKQPLNYEGEPAGQMAVVMYCLSALQYFEDKDLSEIQKVGFEIAMLGRQGIDPSNNEKKYYLDSIPGKEFTGLQLLAYMYSAFQVIDPFLDTGMNFKKEYETAKEVHKGKE
jgi:tetratricopeptide (TPR) repeat protein